MAIRSKLSSFASFPRAALGYVSWSTEPRAKQCVPHVTEEWNPIECNLIDQRQARQGKAPAPQHQRAQTRPAQTALD